MRACVVGTALVLGLCPSCGTGGESEYLEISHQWWEWAQAQEAGDFSNVEKEFWNELTPSNVKVLLHVKSGYISLSLTLDASLLWLKKARKLNFARLLDLLQPTWMAMGQNIHKNALNLKTAGQSSLPMYVKQLSTCIQMLMKLKLLKINFVWWWFRLDDRKFKVKELNTISIWNRWTSLSTCIHASTAYSLWVEAGVIFSPLKNPILLFFCMTLFCSGLILLSCHQMK